MMMNEIRQQTHTLKTTENVQDEKFVLSSKSNGSGFEIVMYHDNGETFSVCHGREAKCAYSFIIQITVSVWIQNK